MAKPGATPTQQFVEIESIENDVAKLKSGGLRKILMVSGVNFDLKSEEEQGLITYAFQGFLNSLNFPVQIFIHSRKLNVEGYLQKLEARMGQEPNELLKNQISEYREFIKNFVSQNAIMDKTFFVVVPYDPIVLPTAGAAGLAGKLTGLFGKKPRQGGASEAEQQAQAEKLKENLEQLNLRVEEITSGLIQIGLRVVPLETQELVELFYNLYNPAATEKKGLPEHIEEISGVIAPPALEIGSNYLKLGDKLAKTLFIFAYPRYLSTGWFSGIINMPELLDISIFIHKVETVAALKKLKRKAAQVESQLAERQQKGLVRDPALETAFQDVENLRDTLQQAREQLFNVGVYITIYAATLEELNKLESKIVNLLESRLVYVKPAIFQQLEGFNSVMPINQDTLLVHSPLNSGPLSSVFPFITANLTSDTGLMYGINRQNNTLVIFDRFSMENANMVIFAKSGSGKSYACKLEILRLLMLGIDVLVIDPENEYENLASAVGGSFFRISLASEHHINPFEIPIIPEGEDPADVLRSHIVNVAGLIKLMVGAVTPEEDAILDRALSEVYASHDIVPGKDFSNAIPPLLEELQKILENMEGGKGLAERLYKFTYGSYAGFTNQATNVDITNRLIVFSIRDLEDQLRPIAMYIVLNFIWNLIRAQLKKRVLIIDEAWVIMKYEDGATFLFGLVKRCRKYFMGVTTITQDVEDFLKSPYGRPIITNSSIQLLLKQAPAMIDTIQKAFNLTEGEKSLLLEAQIGEGLFFAGLNHVAIQIVASFLEDKIVTTKPEQILAEQKK